jgi:magnesium transporter
MKSNDHHGAKQEVDCAHIILFSAQGRDSELSLQEVAPPSHDSDLLWIDVDCDAPELLAEICEKLDLPSAAKQQLVEPGSTPFLRHYGEHMVVQAVGVEHAGNLKFNGAVLVIAAGPNFVVTVHHKIVPFIAMLRKREQGETMLGLLDAPSFVASLLDWQLGTYFGAASDFERAVERLEEEILDGRKDENAKDLFHLRRGASRLRRMLAPHRGLFASLARPDFRPEDDDATSVHFLRLEEQFERAMDIVENARELVIGSFELFSNQIALRTNNAMRLLTFATVVIGCQTVIAGVLGMNFNAPFFQSKALGFWIAIGGMLSITGIAIWIGKRKRWF